MKLWEVLDCPETNLEEKWTKKYKKSINCNNPKGFSQRAHCAGRRKRRAGGTTKSKSVSEANNIFQSQVTEIEITPEQQFGQNHILQRLHLATQQKHLIDGFQIYLYDENNTRLVAAWDDINKQLVAAAVFQHMPKLRSRLYVAKNIEVFPQYQGKQLAGKLYKYCIEFLNMTIQSDMWQSASAKSLWTKTLPALGLHPQILDTTTMRTFAPDKIDPYKNNNHRYCWILEAHDNYPNNLSEHSLIQPYKGIYAGSTELAEIANIAAQESRLDTLVESMLSHLETQGLTEAEAVAHIHERLNEDLRKWFKQKWVRFGPDGKIRGACARGSEGEGKPKCLPQRKAWALGKKRRATAAQRKRREDPNPEREGKAKNVATKESQNFAPAILAETAEESQDINTLAKFITSNILQKREFAYTHVYKLVPADKWPKIKSPIIQQMLSVLRIKNIKDPTRTAKGTIGRDDDGSLWMYIAPGRDPIETASTVAHELTHALDLLKSQGKAFKSGSYEAKPDSSVWTADDWKNYIGNPMEINARFAQVLMFISDDVIENLHNDPNWSLSREELVNWITRLFEFYKIDRSWFAEGPKGQKSYNRLLSRTMQFYQQLDKVARQDAVPKPGLLKKISTAVGSQVAKLISTFGLGKKGELDEDLHEHLGPTKPAICSKNFQCNSNTKT